MKVPDKILAESHLRQNLSYLTDILSWGVHPDTPFRDYIKKDDDTPTFEEEQVGVLERQLDESFDFCEQNGMDIYEVSMVICSDMYGDIFEELHKAYSKKNGKKTNKIH